MPKKQADSDGQKPTRYLKLRLRGGCLRRYQKLHAQKIAANPPLPYTPSVSIRLERMLSEMEIGLSPTRDSYQLLFGRSDGSRRKHL
jgi:hypothetical protein